ncbi:MAG: hypothetical protein KGL18_06110 [Burkholderiales bacterium]|nr:hypothetical protein [Burkholderiales bacterium]MDE1925942.1 hypothetical protein [Burkholderiales bacterium]MDE2157784.1 hypothetical protein [Burkholderiales bacterium]MDE2502537.1 hypothetical protein [Burkholderiales bacterium]
MTRPTAEPNTDRHPVLEAFRRAARAAPCVWARRGERGAVVVGAERREGGAGDETSALLMEALRQAYGAAAAAVAQREIGLDEGFGPALESRRVLQAIACAEAARALDDGRLFGVRLSYSATLGGCEFVAECRRCGVDPAGLSDERCQAIDAEMARLWCGPDLVAEDAAALLCSLLRRRAH